MTAVTAGKRPNLREMLATPQLAALPQSAIRLLELSRNPAAGPAEYASPIEADPGLTGQVLKFVNSSYFGFSRKITSVRAGISLVGVRTIKKLCPLERCFQSWYLTPVAGRSISRAFGKIR